MIRRALASLVFVALFVFALHAVAQESPAPATSAETDAGDAMGDASAMVASPAPEIDAGASLAAVARPSADDGAPVGRAAPPTESATRGGGPIRAGLEVFAQYSYRSFRGPGNNQTWFHAFDVPRVHGAVEGEWEHARGRVVLEATRSASEGSLVGVSGDSLVLRVREAYGAYRPIESLEIAGGVVPTLTAPELDGTWMLRAVAPSGLEANGLLSPADIGVKVRFDAPQGYGWIATAAYNGDGYTSRELNRGKNLEGALEIHPLPNGALRPFGVFASYALGSSGTFRARADRLTSGLVWQGSRLRAGAFFTHAWGVAQLGTQRAIVASAFVRVEPVPRLLFGARLDHAVRDADNDPNDLLTTVWGAAGYRIALPIEAFLALTRSIPTTRAQSELPGSDSWELRAIMRVVF